MAYSGSDYRRLIPNRAIFIDTARDHPIDMGRLWEHSRPLSSPKAGHFLLTQ